MGGRIPKCASGPNFLVPTHSLLTVANRHCVNPEVTIEPYCGYAVLLALTGKNHGTSLAHHVYLHGSAWPIRNLPRDTVSSGLANLRASQSVATCDRDALILRAASAYQVSVLNCFVRGLDLETESRTFRLALGPFWPFWVSIISSRRYNPGRSYEAKRLRASSDPNASNLLASQSPLGPGLLADLTQKHRDHVSGIGQVVYGGGQTPV
jgi:hypothetical protein